MAAKQPETPQPWPPPETFWDRLQRLRNARGVSNEEIAAIADVAYGTVSNWRKGQRPEGRAVARLADYFNVPFDWLDVAPPPGGEKTKVRTAGRGRKVHPSTAADKRARGAGGKGSK